MLSYVYVVTHEPFYILKETMNDPRQGNVLGSLLR